MNKKLIILIGLIIIIGGYLLSRGGYKAPQEFETQTPSSQVPAPGFESVPDTIVEPSGGEPSTAKDVNIVSDNFSFSPNGITLKKDQPVKIIFSNVGIHTFTIDDLGVNVRLTGFSNVAEFTPTKAGTFTFYCAIPGHRERGMVGTLKVEE